MFGEKIDEGGLVVGAGNLFEGFAAGGEEGRAALLADFLERLEAVGDESGAENEKAFFAGLREADEFVVGEWREPRFADKARLEGNGEFFRRDAGAGDEGARGGEDLRAVAGGVGGRAGGAAIGDAEAVGARRVGLAEVARGEPVVAEEDVIVGLREVRRGEGVERFDVVGVGVEGLDSFDADTRREAGGLGENLCNDGFPRRHRVVRVLREEEEFVDAGGGDFGEDGGDRRFAVAHREIDGRGGAERGGKFFADAAGGGEEWRAFGGPDLGVGVRRFFRARAKDDAFEEEPAGGRGEIEDAFVAEEFAQVAADIRDRGGGGRAEVDEEDRAFGHGAGLVGRNRPMSIGGRERCWLAQTNRAGACAMGEGIRCVQRLGKVARLK